MDSHFDIANITVIEESDVERSCLSVGSFVNKALHCRTELFHHLCRANRLAGPEEGLNRCDWKFLKQDDQAELRISAELLLCPRDRFCHHPVSLKFDTRLRLGYKQTLVFRRISVTHKAWVRLPESGRGDCLP